jgi:glycolate oxidase FAD binding subunit
MNVEVPTTTSELAEAVRSHDRVSLEGGRTKPALIGAGGARISTRALRGVVEYDPAEFTFTALAGTPVAEVVAMLAERGQHLPFDPMLVASGSTLGGLVASGVSGPGRLRFGGVRDFILGVRMVDGLGRVLRMGGKVVKNAAGFDVPKFLVGSHGRFGALAEVTFKVFPRPEARRTLRLRASGMADAARILCEAARSRFDFEALDVWPGDLGVMARLAGPMEALGPMAAEALARWPGEVLADDEAGARWAGLREWDWVPAGHAVARVPLTPSLAAGLASHARSFHLMGCASVAWVALGNDGGRERLEAWMHAEGVEGVLMRGEGPRWLGARRVMAVEEAVRAALDPVGRFAGQMDGDGRDGTDGLHGHGRKVVKEGG